LEVRRVVEDPEQNRQGDTKIGCRVTVVQTAAADLEVSQRDEVDIGWIPAVGGDDV